MNDQPTTSPDDTPKETISLEPEETSPALELPKKQSPFRRFGAWYGSHKKLTIPLTILALLAVVLGIPVTRYLVLAPVWKESISVVVQDSQTHTPVSEATVAVGTQTVRTDKTGTAHLTGVAVGDQTLSISKSYYQTDLGNITVPLFAQGKKYAVDLKATGRLVTIKTINKISGAPIANVLLDSGNGNQARSTDDGSATIVVPADKKQINVTLKANGFIDTSAVVSQDSANTLSLTPQGTVYFLSKASGKIDVVSTNLDGSDRKTVYPGTGAESDGDTYLLASRDWKYLVLKSKREADKLPSLYLIETATGTVTQFDSGNADFTLIGWSDHRFLYDTSRNTTQYWQPKHEAIKSLSAESKILTTLEETAAEGDTAFSARYQTLANFYILDGLLSYTKSWYGNTVTDDKRDEIMTVRPDGVAKKTLASYQANQTSYISAKLYEPQEVYYLIGADSGDSTYVKLKDGKVTSASDANFDKAYPTYLVSPSGSATWWAESRDGKNALFIGDKNADNEVELTNKSDYKVYGWYTDDYLLLQKSDSELYITTKDQLKAGAAPVKVSDYHKPIGIGGYGYGYGGL